jgi:peptide deformylase
MAYGVFFDASVRMMAAPLSAGHEIDCFVQPVFSAGVLWMSGVAKIEEAILGSQYAQTGEVSATLDALAALGVLRWNDWRLHQPSEPFDFKRDNGQTICSRLRETMLKICDLHDFSRGFGLAAPQLGILRRVFVFGFTKGDLHFAINPRIVERSTVTEIGFEGCLSLWEWRGRVERPKCIVVEYTDAYGVAHIREESGHRARLILHECDHLDGVIYPDLMNQKDKLIGPRDYAQVKNETRST